MGSFGAFLIEKPSHRLEIRCHVVRSRISIGVSRIRDGGQNDNESGLEVHPCFVVPSLEVVSILVFFAFNGEVWRTKEIVRGLVELMQWLYCFAGRKVFGVQQKGVTTPPLDLSITNGLQYITSHKNLLLVSIVNVVGLFVDLQKNRTDDSINSNCPIVVELTAVALSASRVG
ncbi:hypothetical protein Tco_1107140 [Tanacetum coccineum]